MIPYKTHPNNYSSEYRANKTYTLSLL